MSDIRWTVWDRLNHREVAEFTAPNRQAAEAEAQRRGFSLTTHRVQSVLEFTTFRDRRPEPRRKGGRR